MSWLRQMGLAVFCMALGLATAAPAFGYAVQLAWSPVAEAAGYKLYVSQVSGAYDAAAGEDVGARPPGADGVIRCVVDRGLVVGAVNYFVVTSYGTARTESQFSNELALRIVAPEPPTPAPPPNTTTRTPTASVTEAASSTPTEGPISPTWTATAPSTRPPTPDATVGPPRCVGDCTGDGVVTVDLLATGMSIALGGLPLRACPAFDANGDGQVTIDELLQGVSAAFDGCPSGRW